MEKPSGDALHEWKGVSKNATQQDPFEASMGIYVFKRDVLVSRNLALCCEECCSSLLSSVLFVLVCVGRQPSAAC